jgi:Arc/MetJ-type ribon-helix-helix transcriptional regulator
LSEGVRGALRSSEEERQPDKRRIAALREENRVLRAMVGWQPPSPDSDEEDGGEVEERRGRTGAEGGLQ